MTLNGEPGNIGFGQGPRMCPGKQLADTGMVTLLAILSRHVRKIEMSREELERGFIIFGGHPTGMPLSLTPRTPVC